MISAILLLDLKCGDGVSNSSDSSVLWLLNGVEGDGFGRDGLISFNSGESLLLPAQLCDRSSPC